jgi:hypothetical protein
VYVYRRQDGSTFETEQRMAEDALVDCPKTGHSVERVLQPFTALCDCPRNACAVSAAAGRWQEGGAER